MSAPYVAISLVLFIYALCYALSALAVLMLFSKKFVPAVIRRIQTPVLWWLLLAVLVSLSPPLLSALFNAVAASRPGYAWPDFAGSTALGLWFVWFMVFKPAVPACIVAVISPDIQGFASRRHAIAAYLIHLSCTATIAKMTGWLLE